MRFPYDNAAITITTSEIKKKIHLHTVGLPITNYPH